MADPPSNEGLRTAFRYFNRFMLLLWRLGLGGSVNAWPSVGGRVMVLVQVGRKTGLARRTPLNYALRDGYVYCVAAFGRIADWHKNVVETPRVEVWLPDGWWSGVATDVSDSEARLALVREVLIASGFAARLAGIDPKRMSDADLARATADYCVVRIERTHALTGAGGPGDLSWVWPAATLLLLASFLLG